MPNPSHYSAAIGKSYVEPKKGLDFNDYKNRIPIASPDYPPNEKRFDKINKNPVHASTYRRQPNFKFEKLLPRDFEKSIYPVPKFCAEYDGVDEQKEGVIRRLNVGMVNFKRQSVRNIGEGFGGYMQQRNNV